ncbi:hypothetical protein [Leptospira sanjuanensis]|uniref:hypothetical protein n=1 Tax=Leptospira sanjuanensis TaxID=2879643 RepID=UPI001EE9558A|nr:hypothetical protein [Leptospira sanjuanensis]MCG6170184.1 hypothetical protein [Leptospira sanjuanensis]
MNESDLEKNRKEIISKHSEIAYEYFKYCDDNSIFSFDTFESHQFIIPESGIKQTLLNALIESGSRNIHSTYNDLHFSIGHALGAETVSKNTEDEKLKSLLKYQLRNYYLKIAVIDYFSFLDYIAYHIYDLSFKTLFKNCGKHKVRESQVNFMQLVKKGKFSSDIKNIEPVICREVYRIAFNEFNKLDYRYLTLLRKLFVHRFNPGIDHLLKNVHSPFFLNKLQINPANTLMIFGRGRQSFHVLGSSFLRFKELYPLIIKISKNSRLLMGYMNKKGIISI